MGIRRLIREERGSISVLVIGLFIVLLSTSLVLTDISSIYLAKRSLTQIAESVTQRAMKNLDLESYYVGEFNVSGFIADMAGSIYADPGIPIDCQAGYEDALSTIDIYNQGEVARNNLSNIQLVDFKCDGFEVNLELMAEARIPVKIPVSHQASIQIYSKAGAIGERSESNNYSGFDIG